MIESGCYIFRYNKFLVSPRCCYIVWIKIRSCEPIEQALWIRSYRIKEILGKLKFEISDRPHRNNVFSNFWSEGVSQKIWSNWCTYLLGWWTLLRLMSCCVHFFFAILQLSEWTASLSHSIDGIFRPRCAFFVLVGTKRPSKIDSLVSGSYSPRYWERGSCPLSLIVVSKCQRILRVADSIRCCKFVNCASFVAQSELMRKQVLWLRPVSQNVLHRDVFRYVLCVCKFLFSQFMKVEDGPSYQAQIESQRTEQNKH